LDYERIANGVIGVVALVFGLHAIATRRVTVGEDDEPEQIWLYGWRAIALGCIALVFAVLMFASALGFIQISSA
jgi:hypothetical protein